MTREEKRGRIRMRCTECAWTDTAMRYWDGKRLSHFVLHDVNNRRRRVVR
jgi:ribosomal protein L44E